jgi:putative membrane protein insertion efficiency factor
MTQVAPTTPAGTLRLDRPVGPATWLALLLVRGYRLALAPFTGGQCRFHPSCSDYAEQVIRRDGAWLGSGRALRRVMRCVPFGPGGLDLP